MVHGSKGNHHRRDSSKAARVTPSVVAFLEGVSATHVELPSSFTRRKLYAQYCFLRGYKVKASAKGSYGRTDAYEVRPFDDLLWPEDSVPLPVCSWKAFQRIWQVHFPMLSIRNPCEDTCDDCIKIRNSFKYLDKIGAIRAAASSSAYLLDNLSHSDSDNGNHINVNEYDFLNAHDYPEEVTIMQASKHAIHAQEQRQYATSRIAEAKQSQNNPWEDRRFVTYDALLSSLFIIPFYLNF
jgi:hypothetical protein